MGILRSSVHLLLDPAWVPKCGSRAFLTPPAEAIKAPPGKSPADVGWIIMRRHFNVCLIRGGSHGSCTLRPAEGPCAPAGGGVLARSGCARQQLVRHARSRLLRGAV